MNLSTSPTSSHRLTLDSLGFGLLPLTSGTPFLPIQEQPSCLQSLSQLHSFQEAILENYPETATFNTSSTWDCMPGGEPKRTHAGVCWASCIYTQASPVAASLGLTEQVRNEHRWWPDFFSPLEDNPWLLVSWRCGAVFLSSPVQKSCGTLSQEQQGPLLEPRYKKIPLVLAQISRNLSILMTNYTIIFSHPTLLWLNGRR